MLESKIQRKLSTKVFACVVMLFVLAIPSMAQDAKQAKKDAKVAMNKSDYPAAIEALKIVIKDKPDNKKAHEQLATAVSKTSTVNDSEMLAFYNALNVTKSKSLVPASVQYKKYGKVNYLVTVYEMIQKVDEKEESSLRYLGTYFEESKNWEKAYTYYYRAGKYLKESKNINYNNAGLAAMKIEKWQNGLDAFEEALKKTSKKDEPNNHKIISNNIKWATREVRDEPMRQKLMADSLKIEIENMGPNVNSKWDDYFGAITADESMFLFTSVREGGYGNKRDNGDYTEDFWYCEKDSNGNWGPAKNLGKPINSTGHEGLPSLSADGQNIYFYQSGKKGDGNLYFSNIEGDKWSEPEMLPFCEDEYWETQGTISSDGNTIYFISKRDKEKENSDIYYSTRKRSGKWKKAKNLGKPINTEYNEGSPFIHPDGKTLYFSSRGHAGVGDYDIFKSVMDEKGKWSEPVNVGYPINTRGADNGFFLNAMGTRAFYHSEREGGMGGSDFYMVYLTPKPKPKKEVASADTVKEEVVEEEKVAESVAASSVTTVVGVITDEESGEPIGTTVEMQNLTLNERIQDFKSNSKTGKYVVVIPAGNNYAIAISKKGYLFHSENFNIPKSAASSIITKNIQLKKIEVGKSIVLNNIFFNTGSADLSNESTLELERIIEFMQKETSVKIEISGHTDNVGSDASNQALSEKRAKSVVDYLVGKGIESSRLVSKGYGETQPIASNDTEEGKQRNRRTEFKVIGK